MAMTANTIQKATDGTHIGNSRVIDNGTTLLSVDGGAGAVVIGDINDADTGIKITVSGEGVEVINGPLYVGSAIEPTVSGGAKLGDSQGAFSDLYIGGGPNGTSLTSVDLTKAITATASTESLTIDGVAHTVNLAAVALSSITANSVPIVTTTNAQTLTNKTISGASNTLTGVPLLGSANVFTSAVQTVQGLTTTSPGWYSQITGDAFPRVRVGLNATDVASIGFGGGAGARDAFIERVGAGALRLGAPDAASSVAQNLSVQNVVTGTSNTAGATLTIKGSQGTGTGVGGSIILQVAPAGLTGTSVNALATALTIDSTLKAAFAGTVDVTTSLTSPSTTFNLVNATPTTINFAGAATILNIGTSATVLNFGGGATAAEFRFLEPSGSGTNYSAFKAVAQGANITYSLPPTVGAAGTVLTDVAGNGVLTWAAGGGSSGITIGTTAVTSGTANRVLFEGAGNVVSEDAALTFGAGVTSGNGLGVAASTVTSGNLVSIAASGTAAASNTKTALNVATNGANATSSMTTYGAQFSNTSTGTTSTNVGLKVTASGGATNTALVTGLTTISVGDTTSALTDLLINPTTKASGNFADFQVGGSSKFSVNSAGTVTSAGNINALGVFVGTTLRMNGSGGAGTLLLSSTAPTVSSGFGTSPSIASNNGTGAFTVNVGTGGTATGGVIGLPTATTGWVCVAFDVTNPDTAVTNQTGGTTTTATFTNYSRTTGLATAWAASDILRMSCHAY